MSTSRKVKGYIFQHIDGRYYLAHQAGTVPHISLAHVFTIDEIKDAMNAWLGWGGKEEGKWRVVYEQD